MYNTYVRRSLSQPRDEARHELYAAPGTIQPAKRLRDYTIYESTPKRLCSSPDDRASAPFTARVFSPISKAQVSPLEDDVVMCGNTYHNYGDGIAAEVAVSSHSHQLPIEVQVVSMGDIENVLATTNNIEQKICYRAVKTIISPTFSYLLASLTHYIAL